MNYSISEGVKHSDSTPKTLLAGLPIIFAALLFGPLKMSDNTAPAIQQPHHVVQTAPGSVKRPVNLASSSNGSTGAQTGKTASSAGTNYSSSSSEAATATTSDSTGNQGGGFISPVNPSPPVIAPTTTVGTPPVSVSVDNKPLVSLNGLDLTLN